MERVHATWGIMPWVTRYTDKELNHQGWRNKQNGGNGKLKTGLFQILLNVVGMNATRGEVHKRMDEVMEAAKKLMIGT